LGKGENDEKKITETPHVWGDKVWEERVKGYQLLAEW